MTNRPPGPKGMGLLSTVLNFRRDPLATLTGLTATYGDIVAYRYGPFPVVLLNHPEAVTRVLQDNHPNYGKRRSPFYQMLKWLLGEGLVTSDGDYWKRQRRLAQPSFNRKRLEGWGPMMVQCAADMVSTWKPGTRVDASSEMMALTLRIIGLAMFSKEIIHERDPVGHAWEELQLQMAQRFQSWLPLPPVLPIARDRRFRASRDRLDSLVLHLIAERRAERERANDLLTTLLEAVDTETGETMTDRQICDELVTFLLAGHETTANTLGWAVFLLSRHPDVRRRLEDEVDTALQGRPASVADLARMPFGERVILETMRLYPPAWVYGRRSHGPDEFRGYSIGADQIVTICPYVLHRHPEFWSNPEGFDPDRFLQERPKGAFVPFAAGPRQCIGNYFAMLEARLILATFTQHVRLNLVAGARVDPDPLITLRPRGGVPVTVERRHAG
jgi:cytochrome P450